MEKSSLFVFFANKGPNLQFQKEGKFNLICNFSLVMQCVAQSADNHGKTRDSHNDYLDDIRFVFIDLQMA